jgi:predicted Zn-dependent protease
MHAARSSAALPFPDRPVARAVPPRARGLRAAFASAALASLLFAGGAPAYAQSGAANAPAAAPTLSSSERREVEEGQKLHVQFLQGMGQYNNPELADYVNQIGQKLAKVSDRSQLPWTFTVIDTEDVNAFATMGGFVYISRGILPYLASEAELAAVLGHEIGHITAQHMKRQRRQGVLSSIASAATAIITGQSALGELTNVAGAAIISGYGRDMELEADRIGAELLARTGYDPEAMIRVVGTLKDQERWEVESAKREGRQPRIYHGLFASHPDNDTRFKEAVLAARRVATQTTGRAENQAEFLRRLDGIAWGTSAEQGVVRGTRVYHAAMGFTMAFPSGWNVENGRDRIVGTSPRKDGFMMVQIAPVPPQMQDPRTFVLRGMLANQNVRHSEQLEVNGLPAFTAVARAAQTPFGQKPARVTVVKFNNLYYVFTGVSRSAGDVPDGDRLFLSSAQTFRRLRGNELGLAEPNRIRIVPAPEGATVESLAANSPITDYPVEKLRLFNRLYPKGEPTPGQLVKVVR